MQVNANSCHSTISVNVSLPSSTAETVTPIENTASYFKKETVSEKKKRLHRVMEVRQAQGISSANAARRFNVTALQLRELEHPAFDMPLSLLYQWREILEVPISELLLENDDTLKNPIQSRASLVRIMKTVRTILENAKEKSIQNLAQTLYDQMVDIMPELKDVPAWPSVGQSREAKDYGQALYRRFDQNVERAIE